MTEKQSNYIYNLSTRVPLEKLENCILFQGLHEFKSWKVPNKYVSAVIDELKEAAMCQSINHPIFGNGEIINDDGMIITCKFETETKKIGKSFAISQGWLS